MKKAEYMLESLHYQLQCHYAHWNISDLTIIGQGLEALIYKANTTTFGSVSIKVPWTRWISNDNDASLDGRELLKQEALLASHLRAFQVATPEIYALHLGDDDYDFLVSEFIDHDKSLPDSYAFGRLMKAIHASPLVDNVPVMARNKPLVDILAERIVQRIHVVERLGSTCFSFPGYNELHSMLEWPGQRYQILHMDARPDNILTRQGAIIAIIDWSNALYGDPALELARIGEYGYIDQAFLQGYSVPDFFASVPKVIELLYRLDTAIMLAVVFLSESPDPLKARLQVERVHDLCALLGRER